MRKHTAFSMAMATGVWAVATGCLPPFVAPPNGDPQPGGGAASNAGGGGASASDDAGTAPAPPAPPGAALDMAGAPAGDLAPASGDMAKAAVACDTLQSTAGLPSPSGHHNPGQECQGCHAPGGGAPTFYLGGTLYSAASGGTAVAGATINVTDAAGKTLKIVSATNGNFWTSTALSFPLKVNASLCPSTVPMNSTVGGNGACNNCHNSTFRVHVP